MGRMLDMQKIKAQHLKSFNEALVVAEHIAKERTSNICFFAGSNRVEMNRMIAANNAAYAKFEEVYQKFYEHFESQFMDDIDIAPFTPEDVNTMTALFQLKMETMNKVKQDLSQYSTDNMVTFSITAEISRVGYVFDDIVDIIKRNFMGKNEQTN